MRAGSAATRPRCWLSGVMASDMLRPLSSRVSNGRPMPATPTWPPKSAPRLFVAGPLAESAAITIDGPQAHYLAKVMRVAESDAVMLCDDITGEWMARVTAVGKRDVVL